MIEEAPATTSSAWPIWGHDHAVNDLQAAAIRGPHHAYILSGFTQVGKATLAILFAQALLCTNPVAAGVPCLECSACRRVAHGTHPDCSMWDIERQVKLADKGSTSRNLTLNIDTVREISSSLAMRPLEARYRVVIVDDMESMQETAQEAFLKTLEEPPAYAVILLLTTDAELMLETIRSRAVTIPLQTVPTARIEAGLRIMGIGGDQISEIAEASDGRPGWAIMAAKDPSLLADRLTQLAAADEWIASDRYHQLVEATRLGDAFAKDRTLVFQRLTAVQRQWRTHVLQDLTQDTDVLAKSVAALKSVDTCLRDLDANVRPKLAIQTMVLQWPITNS